jgi:transcriptional regulator with XRE-family HTH domain
VFLLQLERIRRRWSQAELARRAGLWQQEVSLIERGHRRPSRPRVKALASVLGIDAGRLFEDV